MLTGYGIMSEYCHLGNTFCYYFSEFQSDTKKITSLILENTLYCRTRLTMPKIRNFLKNQNK